MISLGEQELDQYESVFKALAHQSRRQVLVVLHARGGTMTAGEIASRFACSWPTTTRHLRVLQEANMITVTRKSREWVYVLNFDFFNLVICRWLDVFKG